jgi:hypothetical protein
MVEDRGLLAMSLRFEGLWDRGLWMIFARVNFVQVL